MYLHDSESSESIRGKLRGWFAESLAAHGPVPYSDDRKVRRKYDIGWPCRLGETGYPGINGSRHDRGRGARFFGQLGSDEEDSEAIANIIAQSRPGQFDGE